MASDSPPPPATEESSVGDAFGQALLAHLHGEDGSHRIVRDDGYTHVADAARYFGGVDAWSQAEAAALEAAGGRVLDVGAGAGRVSLAVTEAGLEATAIDTSPGAVEVCRARGVSRAVVGSVDGLPTVEPWDTVTLFGSNLGLMRDPVEAPRFLAEVRRRTVLDGLLLGSSRDPALTDDPAHLAYHRRNRARGRMIGQVTIRVEFGGLVTPWFDYLYVSPDDLARIVPDTGWDLVDTLDEGEPFWVAVLRAV
jgi:SAM-dependent methyltransferase